MRIEQICSMILLLTNFITGVTIGLFNFKDSETQSGAVAHAGWNLKTTGSGGRASEYHMSV